MKKITVLTLVLALLLCGCNSGDPNNPSNNGNATAPNATVDFSKSEADLFTDRDYRTTYDGATPINLSEANDTVTITKEGTYLLSGSLTGSVVVQVGDQEKVQLVLNNAEIYNENGAAICILQADKVFLTLAEGSENTLQTGQTLESIGEYTINGGIYSRSDLTLNGSGNLTITCPGGHGITCKDDLAIVGGTYHIESANQALDANDSIRISNGHFTLRSGKDGIHAENTEDTTKGFIFISGGSFDIEAEGDGISASCYLQIENGNFKILAGGGYENGTQHSSDNWGNMGGMGGGRPRSGSTTATEDASSSMKGLKATAGILVNAGTFDIDSADDALHSDTILTINGGDFTIASGDDGVHAEDALTITACTMNITTCYEGLEGAYIYVMGGEMTMICSDDGLNAAGGVDESGTSGGRDGMFGGGFGGMSSGDYGYIEISGGRLIIHASGDGLDSNGDLCISGGYTQVFNPKSGDTSILDSQNSPVITGGTYIGLGISTTMAQTFSNASTQGVIACTIGNQSAGTNITITDSKGNVVLTTQTEYSTVLMIVSTPQIVKGKSYDITVGSISGNLEAN